MNQKAYRVEIEIDDTKGVRIGTATLLAFNPVPATVNIIKKVYLTKIVADDYIIRDLLAHISKGVTDSIGDTSTSDESDYSGEESTLALNELGDTLVDIGRS